jgi:GMP synthase (glutamine-hydrolysing)
MILIIDMNKNRLSSLEFVKPIERIVGKKFLSRHYSKINEEALKKADKIIISGNALMDNDFLADANIDKFSWLLGTNTPVLGICAGMQVISKVFGGSTSEKKEIGIIKIKTIEKNALFSGDFSAYCLHRNKATVPKEFIELANSDSCVQAFKHKHRPIYGVLFHPEVRNEQIIAAFCTGKNL